MSMTLPRPIAGLAATSPTSDSDVAALTSSPAVSPLELVPGLSSPTCERLVEIPDRPWLASYPRCIPSRLQYPALPLWWLLEEAARNWPDRVACCLGIEPDSRADALTYRQLFDQARRAATLFRRLGVGSGDRVGLLLPNTPDYLIAAYGVWMAGGVVVSLSPLMVAREVSDLIAATGCRLVVGLDLLAPLAHDGEHRPQQFLSTTLAHSTSGLKRIGYSLLSLRRVGLRPWLSGVTWSRFRKELASVEPMPDLKLVHPQSPAFILPTGGTTGHPKAVLLSHANLLANAWQLHTWTGRRSGKDTLISVIPFFHSYGLSTCLTNGTAMGATLLLHPKFETEVVRRMLDERKPTVFPAVPAMLHVLNQRLREAPVQAKSLMWVISGGAALDPAVASEFAEHTRSRVVQGYGLSECSPVTHAGPLDGSDRPGTIGLPLPDTEAKIVSADGGTESLPPGEVGELMIRGPQVMLGYWNDAAATQAAFRDGWLATGDLATRDADGFFRIVDRKKDLIITSGFNVYPSDVEATIREYPGVHEAAVVGVPDEQRGEVVKAVIAMHPGQACRVQDMAAFLSTRLARHKQPRVIEIVEGDLPRNFLGKVLRRKLRTPGAEVKS